MSPRDIARIVREEMDRQGRLTRGIERAIVVGREVATGNTIVSYKGANISLGSEKLIHWEAGQTVRLERTNAGLQVGGRSAYGRR